MTATDAIQANAQRRYEVRRADLPLSCPLPSMAARPIVPTAARISSSSIENAVVPNAGRDRFFD